MGAAHPRRKLTPATAGLAGAKDGESHALTPISYPSWPATLQAPKTQRARQGVRVVSRASAQLHIPRDPPHSKQWGLLPPPQNVPVGVGPLGGHNLPPSPQQVTFSAPPKKPHLLLIPTTEAQQLPQTGGWGLPPAPCPDIWVSLSLHISSQHLKPFFSWQK